jgi:hypothetical protein
MSDEGKAQWAEDSFEELLGALGEDVYPPGYPDALRSPESG